MKNRGEGGDFSISTTIFRRVTPLELLKSSFLQQPMWERQVACIPATIARQAPKRERRNPLRVFRRKGWRQTPWRMYLDEGSGMNISSEAAPPPPPPNCQRTPSLGSAFAPDRAFLFNPLFFSGIFLELSLSPPPRLPLLIANKKTDLTGHLSNPTDQYSMYGPASHVATIPPETA